ncbi:hypothetical protein [Streptomyces sp. NPDC056323]|uniref:hypothetical protein n=1 Tax=unclassified Streptomyces TaxID=2593676 RepID=UPI0035E1F679
MRTRSIRSWPQAHRPADARLLGELLMLPGPSPVLHRLITAHGARRHLVTGGGAAGGRGAGGAGAAAAVGTGGYPLIFQRVSEPS